MVYCLDLDYATIVCTKKLPNQALHAELLDVLSILAGNDIYSVKILFGDAWGMDYKNFTPFSILVQHIPHEILKAEFRDFGTLGHDDFLIQLEEFETEILFSHESLIHLCFNDRNSIVKEIIDEWKLKGII